MIEKARRVVIRGVGVISCLGVSASANWTRLLKNESGIGVLDPNLHGHSPCHIGGAVNNEALEERWNELIKNQSHLRGVEKQIDRRAMSRTSVLGMLAAQEALKQSGWLPQDCHPSFRDYSSLDSISYRAGTYFSTGLEGIEEIVTSQAKINNRGYTGMGAHVLPRTLSNMPVAHISRAWGLRGPTMSCNTACASGLHSIGEAFRMIQYGEADMVLAGASEAPLIPWALMAFSRIRALSGEKKPSIASRPFDSARSGFVMAEGAAAIVLEAWPPKNPSASSLHPPIAEVLGFGRSADAFSLVSPEPSGDGAFRCMKAALDDAGVESLNDLGHINCHATSTPIGDVIELSAVARLLSSYGKRSPTASPIHVNSIKGHLGHSLGAAGAIETVYSAISAHLGVCIPNCNLEKPISPDEIFKTLERTGDKKAAREITDKLFENITFEADYEWAKKSKRRLVLTNAFGFGGTNGCLLLSNWVE